MNTDRESNDNGNLPTSKISSRFIVITYMIYIITWECLVIGGLGYVVFELNRSGWWMLLAVMLSMEAYTPKQWRQLVV